MPESLDEVVDGVGHLLLAHGVQDGQEGVEGHAAVRLLALHQPPDVGLRGVLAEGADHLADLGALENAREENGYGELISFMINVCKRSIEEGYEAKQGLCLAF